MLPTKSQMLSNKRLQLETLDLIHAKCRNDHFSYLKKLPQRQNLSSNYSTSFERRNSQSLHAKGEQNELDQSRKMKQIPKGNLSQQFSPKQFILPRISSNSTYNSSYLVQKAQSPKIAQAQKGYFMKMSWHQKPQSNYRKCFQLNQNNIIEKIQKGKATDDNIVVFQKKFRGKSIYQECYQNVPQGKQFRFQTILQNKDHLKQPNIYLKRNSQYRNNYQNKQNFVTDLLQKTIDTLKPMHQQTQLPSIKKTKSDKLQKVISDMVKKTLKISKKQLKRLD